MEKMNSVFSLLLYFLLSMQLAIAAPPSATNSFPKDCKERMIRMDESFKFGMIITNPKERIYESEPIFNRDYCLPMKNHSRIISEYKPCLKAFPKQLFSMVMSQGRKQVNRICKTTESRKELINNFKCITKDTFKEGAMIGHGITSLFEHVLKLRNIDMVIPTLCCGYQVVMDESRALLNRLCTKQGVGPAGSEYILNLLQGSVSDALDMMCGGYSTAEQCNSKDANIIKNVKAVQRRDKNETYEYSALVPIIKIVNRIDNETNV